MKNHKLIRFILNHEKEIREAIKDKRNAAGNRPTGGGNGHSRVSDPTANKAIANVTPIPAVTISYGARTFSERESITIRKPEEWLVIIEYADDVFRGTIYGALLQMKYRENRTREKICQAMNVGKTQYHAIDMNIMFFIEGCAIGKGILLPNH